MKVTIVGIGNVGSSLLFSLHETGFQIVNVVGKDLSILKKLSGRVGSDYSVNINSVAGDGSETIIICVKDGQLGVVCNSLKEMKNSLRGRTIFHTSGSVSSEVFKGILPSSNSGSFHPIQTFNKITYKNNHLFEGITIGIEGGKKCIKLMREIALKFNSVTLNIPIDKKPLYHLASVIASNFLVCYIDIINDIMKTVNKNITDVSKVFSPIISKTLNNVYTYGVDKSLTGPIVRNDIKTLKAHLSSIDNNNDLQLFYKTISKRAVEIAYRNGKMDKDKYNSFIKLLSY
ncbi:DUF2520 domain-containing protein [Ignavibacteria bacterium CHB1]|nr:MAG: DUF2520 domain-containing protein [Chlorobiota bacterium]MBV6398782.1 hypothetical protein [Ignavibacteria bacterium]MCC6885046.1 DUF2520 domain-containing protein [Ignavibacteriales bacterium]MCE7952163.1 DUF2520 domain-containing protein [Chlorobi bacterium CHB7]MDL1886280.1 DUF2520 domain-containing protein [Ignavibacteria bacterium CHB1]RIK49437.1 MAG: hypothetical protein DCC60_03820 [Ignavibacteriota bacterium]